MRRTDPAQLRALEGRLASLPGEAMVQLPAAFVDGVLRDLKDAEEASALLDEYRDHVTRALALGEEYV